MLVEDAKVLLKSTGHLLSGIELPRILLLFIFNAVRDKRVLSFTKVIKISQKFKSSALRNDLFRWWLVSTFHLRRTHIGTLIDAERGYLLDRGSRRRVSDHSPMSEGLKIHISHSSRPNPLTHIFHKYAAEIFKFSLLEGFCH